MPIKMSSQGVDRRPAQSAERHAHQNVITRCRSTPRPICRETRPSKCHCKAQIVAPPNMKRDMPIKMSSPGVHRRSAQYVGRHARRIASTRCRQSSRPVCRGKRPQYIVFTRCKQSVITNCTRTCRETRPSNCHQEA